MISSSTESPPRPVLISFSGLPGTGKSSIALGLAARVSAIYLRIDTIEQAIRDSPGVKQAVNEEGYRVAKAVAMDNLRLGKTVISDSVNPMQETRDAWHKVAGMTNATLIEVEIVCSDADAHRLRVESRTVSVPGLKLPTWKQVLAREYHPWNRDHLVLDTAYKSVAECVAELEAAIGNSVS